MSNKEKNYKKHLDWLQNNKDKVKQYNKKYKKRIKEDFDDVETEVLQKLNSMYFKKWYSSNKENYNKKRRRDEKWEEEK